MEKVMISRVWHGWTSAANADAYENLLRTEIFPGIFTKGVAGFERIELFRRELGKEVRIRHYHVVHVDGRRQGIRR
jgi:hypothetical protein